MSSTIGERIRITVFGESHGEAVGVVLEGLPAGEPVDGDCLQAFLNRRAPGRSPLASARSEADRPRFLSGLKAGRATGAPLCAVIDNGDARPEDYASVADVPRPGHADYPASVRYGGHADLRGGGHLSGRLTAPLCVAGGIALQALARRGVTVGAHIASIGEEMDTPFDPVLVSADDLLAPGKRPFPVIGEEAGARMQAAIAEAMACGDSIGGTVECGATGLAAGLGAPIFGGVESRLSALLFGIPAVRGVSFGAGFEAARMRGTQHNDAYAVRGGAVVTETNRHGGVLGGMTTGMPLLLHVAIKPTPSIAAAQRSVRLSTLRGEAIRVHGRHDPCIVPRAVPCVEAATALALLDVLLEGGG